MPQGHVSEPEVESVVVLSAHLLTCAVDRRSQQQLTAAREACSRMPLLANALPMNLLATCRGHVKTVGTEGFWCSARQCAAQQFSPIAHLLTYKLCFALPAVAVTSSRCLCCKVQLVATRLCTAASCRK